MSPNILSGESSGGKHFKLVLEVLNFMRHTILRESTCIEVYLFKRNYTACTREHVKQHATVGWRE